MGGLTHDFLMLQIGNTEVVPGMGNVMYKGTKLREDEDEQNTLKGKEQDREDAD